MAKWILLTIGFLLLVPGLAWFFYNPVGPDEASVVFKDLAAVPAADLRQKRMVNVSVTAPDDRVWRHIRHKWGEPQYEIALASPLKEHQFCFDGISATASEAGRELNLEPGTWMYGFGMDELFARQCQSVGSIFRARPGSRVNVTLTAGDQFASGESIVVRPVWYNTKDKLVGVDIDKDIRTIVTWPFLVGLGLCLLAGVLFLQSYIRKQFALHNKVVA